MNFQESPQSENEDLRKQREEFYAIIKQLEEENRYYFVRNTQFASSDELPHDKTNRMACAPSEVSDQPGLPPSLIRVFAVCMKKASVLSYPLSTQWILWSDRADAQADLSLHWAQRSFCWFCHEVAHMQKQWASCMSFSELSFLQQQSVFGWRGLAV